MENETDLLLYMRKQMEEAFRGSKVSLLNSQNPGRNGLSPVVSAERRKELHELVESDGFYDGRIFYCYHEGKFYRSLDGGIDFELVNDSLPQVEWFDLVIVQVSPSYPDEVWVTLGEHGLFRSVDGGRTFFRLEAVEEAYLFAFGEYSAIAEAREIYISGHVSGDGDGIFKSLDRGLTWTRCDTLMPTQKYTSQELYS